MKINQCWKDRWHHPNDSYSPFPNVNYTIKSPSSFTLDVSQTLQSSEKEELKMVITTKIYIYILVLTGKTMMERFKMPERSIPKDAAYQIIHDELMLDGNPRLNLASFVATWMEPECDRQAHHVFHQQELCRYGWIPRHHRAPGTTPLLLITYICWTTYCLLHEEPLC